MAGNDDTYCTGLGCKQHHRDMETKHYSETIGYESAHIDSDMIMILRADAEKILEFPDDDLRALIGKYL